MINQLTDDDTACRHLFLPKTHVIIRDAATCAIDYSAWRRGEGGFKICRVAHCSYWMHLPHLYSPGQKKRVVTLPWTKIGNSLGSPTFCASALDAITCNWTRGPILACCRTVHIAHAQFSPLFGMRSVSNIMNIT